MINPYILDLEAIHNNKGGNLSYLQPPQLPFEVKRVYWIYELEEGARRGGHSHKSTDRVLICVQGQVGVSLKNKAGDEFDFQLDNPSKALYFPRDHWIDINCGRGAILLTLASTSFEEDIQETDYEAFMTRD